MKAGAAARANHVRRSRREPQNLELTMIDDRVSESEQELTDLGAATELTQGIWDPMLKESFVMPQARDM